MKLPGAIATLLQTKTNTVQSAIFSLVLDSEAVLGTFWLVSNQKIPELKLFASKIVTEDSWEARTNAIRLLLNEIEGQYHEKAHEVVLGLPPWYLSVSGEIKQDERHALKKLLAEFSLKPLGFVPLDEAIIYTLKKEEGVPPNAILLAVTAVSGAISLYKVGSLVGRKQWSRATEIAGEVEGILKDFTEVEVLPSRILLYGGNLSTLEKIKNELLRFPWATRTNFLHFPKIEILQIEKLLKAVSLAGASEITGKIGEEEEVNKGEKTEKAVSAVSAVAQPSTLTQEAHKIRETFETEEIIKAEEEEETEESADSNIERDGQTEENFEVVTPESLGFNQKIDILQKPPPTSPLAMATSVKTKFKPNLPAWLTKSSSGLPNLAKFLSRKSWKFGFIIFPLFIFVFFIVYWWLPSATITILVVPQIASASASITVDPRAIGVDENKLIIPGNKQEKILITEKVSATTGKKKVGEPAKGTVTIYNKSLTGLNLSRGTTLIGKGLKFSLDNDVKIASASENLVSGTITYGKANAGITAGAIGSESNLAAGAEFTISDYSSSILVARNEQALTGGISRDVVVVSRADYDGLLKLAVEELTTQAKTDLVSSVSAQERLIEETLKTTVKEKQFKEEIDEEASNLHGKVTLGVSAITYRQADLASLLTELAKKNLPSGYLLSENSQNVTAQNVKMKTDGTVDFIGLFNGRAMPDIPLVKIQQEVSGKKLSWVSQYLQGLSGVGGVSFGFGFSLWKNQLPANSRNITIKVKTL